MDQATRNAISHKLFVKERMMRSSIRTPEKVVEEITQVAGVIDVPISILAEYVKEEMEIQYKRYIKALDVLIAK